MQFEVKISLSEMLSLLAWNEAVTADELGRSGPPPERAYQSEWDAQVEECRTAAQADPELGDLVQLLDDCRDFPLMPTADALKVICRTQIAACMKKREGHDANHDGPGPNLLKMLRKAWPPVCRQLYSLARARRARLRFERLKWKKKHSTWSMHANSAFGPVEGKAWYHDWWAKKEPCDKEPTKISRESLNRLPPQWATDQLELPSGRGPGRDRLDQPVAFTNVECSRESFACWLLSQQQNDPVSAVAQQLKSNRYWRRPDAFDWCKKQFGVSQREFQNKIWPAARLRAGLPAKAPPGPKPRSSR